MLSCPTSETGWVNNRSTNLHQIPKKTQADSAQPPASSSVLKPPQRVWSSLLISRSQVRSLHGPSRSPAKRRASGGQPATSGRARERAEDHRLPRLLREVEVVHEIAENRQRRAVRQARNSSNSSLSRSGASSCIQW